VFTISKTFGFEASHELRDLPSDHQCRRNHGHSYTVTLVLGAAVLVDHMVRDYGDLDSFRTMLKASFDHRLINDVMHTDMPTAETLACYFYEWASERWPEMLSCTVAETAATTATFSK
jgi:6-pyruvoyltetrahydropterin/6-carboxytetrahydropterin synthase